MAEYGSLAPQMIPVGDYQMPAFGAAQPPQVSPDDTPPLIAKDGMPFWQRRSGESSDDHQARLQPFYAAVGPLQQQFSQKEPSAWTPQESERFRASPGFIAAARLAFPSK